MREIEGGFSANYVRNDTYDRLHLHYREYVDYAAYASEPLTFWSSSLPTVLISLVLAILGARSLRQSLELRFAISNAFVQTGELKPAEKARLLGERVRFACFHTPEALLTEIELDAQRDDGSGPASHDEILNLLNSSKCEVRIKFDKVMGWHVDGPVPDRWYTLLLDGIRNPAQKERQRNQPEQAKREAAVKRQKRRQVLRNLPRIRDHVPEWSNYQAELAEERLWAAYFCDPEQPAVADEVSSRVVEGLSAQLLARLDHVREMDIKLAMLQQSIGARVPRLALPIVIDIRDEGIDARAAEPLVEAVLRYLRSFELEPEPRERWALTTGCFCARLRATYGTALGRDGIETLLKEVETGLTHAFVRLPGSEADRHETEATRCLLTALSRVGDAVIALGPVILVKSVDAPLFTIPLWEQIRLAMETNPACLASAEAFHALLSRIQAPQLHSLTALPG